MLPYMFEISDLRLVIINKLLSGNFIILGLLLQSCCKQLLKDNKPYLVWYWLAGLSQTRMVVLELSSRTTWHV